MRRTPGAGGEEVAGYAVYTCHTSLCATIIVLAYPWPEVKASFDSRNCNLWSQ